MTGPAPEAPPEPRFLLGAGITLYSVLTAVALLWLWLRERLDVLPLQAVGEHGPLAAVGMGLSVGAVSAAAMAILSRRLAALRAFEIEVGRVFGAASDTAAAVFVVVGAVGEELLFRLAVQDAFGLAGSVAAAVGLHSCLGGWRWSPLLLMHALLLGLVVQQGFGLLGSTTANAVLNYLNLRRIQCG